MKVPGVDRLWSAAGERFVKGSTGGPDAEARSTSGSHIVAIAYDAAGRQLSEVHVTGVDGYTFTGRMLAWGAERAAAGGAAGHRRARPRGRLRTRRAGQGLRGGRDLEEGRRAPEPVPHGARTAA